jgi:hypothetical protein
MSEDKITKAVNDKKRIMDFERNVEAQTVEVFNTMKQIFTEVLTSVGDHEVSVSSSDNSITAKVYDTTIGCARLNGVAILRDGKLINASTLEEMEFKNYRSLILDETYSHFITGMIVIYVQSPGTRKGVVSRFYVNKDKQVAFRQHIGWHMIEFIRNDLSNKLKPLIEASIESALFEGETSWNHTHQVFDSLEELGLANEIGFRK